MSSYAFGKSAAVQTYGLEKVAIQWKSPKMQSILQNATDQAYQVGRQFITAPLPGKYLRTGFIMPRPDLAILRQASADGRAIFRREEQARGGPSFERPTVQSQREVLFRDALASPSIFKPIAQRRKSGGFDALQGPETSGPVANLRDSRYDEGGHHGYQMLDEVVRHYAKHAPELLPALKPGEEGRQALLDFRAKHKWRLPDEFRNNPGVTPNP